MDKIVDQTKDRKTYKCNLCDAIDFKFLYKMNTYEIVKCRNCGLIFTTSPHSNGFFNNLYQEKVDLKNTLLFSKKEDVKNELAMYAKTIKYLKRFKNDGRLLDLGSGLGHFLEIANNNGYEATGVELGKEKAAFAKKILKLEVINANAEEVEFKAESFDIIVLMELIEHTNNPLNLLKKINKILKPDGIIYVTTPNINFLARWLLGNQWLILTPPWHLYFFNRKTLNKIFNRAGFSRAAEINYCPHLTLFNKNLKAIFKKQ